MRRLIGVAISLLVTTSAMADEMFDAAYVSNPSVCSRAEEDDLAAVLFEEKAWLVYPSRGILGGEMTCYFHGLETQTNGLWAPELAGMARCFGFETNFIDQIVVAPDSFNINLTFGDDGIEHQPGEMVEVISMRGLSRPPEYEDYAGVYARCDALSEKVPQWFD